MFLNLFSAFGRCLHAETIFKDHFVHFYACFYERELPDPFTWPLLEDQICFQNRFVRE